MLTPKRKKIVFIVLAVIVGIWILGFVARISALNYVKSKLSKGLVLSSELTLSIKNLNYSLWGLSVSGRDIVLRDKQEKLLFAESAVFKIKTMSLSLQKIPFRISIIFPDKGKAVIDGKASLQNKKISSLAATCKIENFSLVSLNPLMNKYFSDAPLSKSGRVFLTSDMGLKGTKFHSSNELKLEGLHFENGGDLGSQILNIPRNAMLSFIKNSQGSFTLNVNVNGDFSSSQFNWPDIVSSAMAQALANAVSNIENPGKDILEQPLKILEDIF